MNADLFVYSFKSTQHLLCAFLPRTYPVAGVVRCPCAKLFNKTQYLSCKNMTYCVSLREGKIKGWPATTSWKPGNRSWFVKIWAENQITREWRSLAAVSIASLEGVGNHDLRKPEKCPEYSRQLSYSMQIFHRTDFSASGSRHTLLWAFCTRKTLLGKEPEDQPLESALNCTLVEIIAAFFFKLQASEVTTGKICDRHLTLRNCRVWVKFFTSFPPPKTGLLTNKGKVSKTAGVR